MNEHGEMVCLRDVRKTYHMGEVEIHAVDGLSLEIREGEFAVVVGPSGAGKTTVLNIHQPALVIISVRRQPHIRTCRPDS